MTHSRQTGEPNGTTSIIGSTTRRRRLPVSRLRGEGTDARRAWRTAYVRRIVVGDGLAALAAAAIAYVVRFGPQTGPLSTPHAPIWMVAILPVLWLAVMLSGRTYEERFLWVGAEEFRRVFFAAMLMLATVGTISWAFKLEIARGFVVIALPLSAGLTLLHRLAQRGLLHRARERGHKRQTTVIVGHRNGVISLHAQLERQAYHGYDVIGCCIPQAGADATAEHFDGLPVLGGLDEVARVVRDHEIDTVAVLPSPELDGAALRQLGWDLETTKAELLLAPAVTEIVGTRVQIRPVCGLPLMHVERPEFTGLRRVVKAAFDRVAAGLVVLAIAPALLTIALTVKLTSRGPVFFRHERVGQDGQPFHVLKFRTMVPGSDRQIDDLRDQSDGNTVQFKMKSDPRVTPVGKYLRRYSLDELPQLFNVLGGSMSLVGPRPHVTREVEQYGFDMRRRLLVKPGITGLWQVSGRSNLSWDDSVRIDVRYVENWSLSFDLMIIAKTVGAVVRGSGAY
ncbi:sugar transferase [Modestobacter altitudinis]|uniref:sugar transferase n=1 Tax=Modestobacter altitudinis TaxID=2213158 RepID=UPI002482AF81|nr:sugar transferase [Modestobacter altitudinis]